MMLASKVKYAETTKAVEDGDDTGRFDNINLSKYTSPTPVDSCYGEVDGQKIYDPVGNVWRHSCSLLTLMPGFQVHPAYDDFTLPTIDGLHNFILGGSFISL